MVIGVMTEGRVICLPCYMKEGQPLADEWAEREGYPDGFTCDDCDKVVL